MDRRLFLGSLFGAALGPEALERLLWVPTKTIFIPKPRAYWSGTFSLDTFEVNGVDVNYNYKPLGLQNWTVEVQFLQDFASKSVDDIIRREIEAAKNRVRGQIL